MVLTIPVVLTHHANGPINWLRAFLKLWKFNLHLALPRDLSRLRPLAPSQPNNLIFVPEKASNSMQEKKTVNSHVGLRIY